MNLISTEHKQKENGYRRKKIAGYFLILLGALFTIPIFGLPFNWNADSHKVLIGVLMIGVLPLTIGLFLFFDSKKKLEELEKLFKEQVLISLVKKYSGKISPLEVSADMLIGIEEARQLLEMCVTKGFAICEVNNDGVVEFIFPELLG